MSHRTENFLEKLPADLVNNYVSSGSHINWRHVARHQCSFAKVATFVDSSTSVSSLVRVLATDRSFLDDIKVFCVILLGDNQLALLKLDTLHDATEFFLVPIRDIF